MSTHQALQDFKDATKVFEHAIDGGIDAFISANNAAAALAEAMRDICRVNVIEPAWLHAHPGRRLPGGSSNDRLEKKRRDYLWRWWEEEGMDQYWWSAIPLMSLVDYELKHPELREVEIDGRY